MNPYKENSVCIKCGSTFSSTEYIPEDHESSLDISDETEEIEFIKRVCNTCGYTWAEYPLNLFLLSKEKEDRPSKDELEKEKEEK